eukprot:CAMPEP_0194422184 /NCGR_PEP_ID=MMETSP0176-20130528/21438_1 /TAXON_ID=216777 /ORGANISM="Proboscia alata, Strain PI-D3" /LENGTH=1157 /DNA_ID=CAMNT_0039230709 /DNA_START=144 /DNA_END=3617 /DNA_ORIENTATION=+
MTETSVTADAEISSYEETAAVVFNQISLDNESETFIPVIVVEDVTTDGYGNSEKNTMLTMIGSPNTAEPPNRLSCLEKKADAPINNRRTTKSNTTSSNNESKITESSPPFTQDGTKTRDTSDDGDGNGLLSSISLPSRRRTQSTPTPTPLAGYIQGARHFGYDATDEETEDEIDFMKEPLNIDSFDYVCDDYNDHCAKNSEDCCYKNNKSTSCLLPYNNNQTKEKLASLAATASKTADNDNNDNWLLNIDKSSSNEESSAKHDNDDELNMSSSSITAADDDFDADAELLFTPWGPNNSNNDNKNNSSNNTVDGQSSVHSSDASCSQYSSTTFRSQLSYSTYPPPYQQEQQAHSCHNYHNFSRRRRSTGVTPSRCDDQQGAFSAPVKIGNGSQDNESQSNDDDGEDSNRTKYKPHKIRRNKRNISNSSINQSHGHQRLLSSLDNGMTALRRWIRSQKKKAETNVGSSHAARSAIRNGHSNETQTSLTTARSFDYEAAMYQDDLPDVSIRQQQDQMHHLLGHKKIRPVVHLDNNVTVNNIYDASSDESQGQQQHQSHNNVWRRHPNNLNNNLDVRLTSSSSYQEPLSSNSGRLSPSVLTVYSDPVLHTTERAQHQQHQRCDPERYYCQDITEFNTSKISPQPLDPGHHNSNTEAKEEDYENSNGDFSSNDNIVHSRENSNNRRTNFENKRGNVRGISNSNSNNNINTRNRYPTNASNSSEQEQESNTNAPQGGRSNINSDNINSGDEQQPQPTHPSNDSSSSTHININNDQISDNNGESITDYNRNMRPSSESSSSGNSSDDPERQARLRWISINQRFRIFVTFVALLFSLLICCIVICWFAWIIAYFHNIHKKCDVPLKRYFWCATFQLMLDLCRAPISQHLLRYNNVHSTTQRVPNRVILYNIAYLTYAMLVLRIGCESVYQLRNRSCNHTAPELFRVSKFFVTLSVSAWASLIFGYLVPFGIVSIILTRNGYTPGGYDMNFAGGGGGHGGNIFPTIGWNSKRAAPPECIDSLRVVLLEEFPENYTKVCCICIGEFAPGEVIVATECEHIFHKQCCKEWLEQARTCPVCRVDIPNSLGLLNNDENRVMHNMGMGGLGMGVGELDIGDLQTSVGDGSNGNTSNNINNLGGGMAASTGEVVNIFRVFSSSGLASTARNG